MGQTNTGQLNNALINTGTVSTSGSNARAASILGGSGTINNSGTLSTTGTSSNGAFLQGNTDQLINSGKIVVTGAGSDAVFSNTVGSSFTATIQNLAGGQIISQSGIAIRTLNGNTTVVNAGLVQSNVGTAISMVWVWAPLGAADRLYHHRLCGRRRGFEYRNAAGHGHRIECVLELSDPHEGRYRNLDPGSAAAQHSGRRSRSGQIDPRRQQ